MNLLQACSIIDDNVDEIYEFVGENLYSEACDYSPQFHADDQHEEILEAYIEGCPEEVVEAWLNSYDAYQTKQEHKYN